MNQCVFYPKQNCQHVLDGTLNFMRFLTTEFDFRVYILDLGKKGNMVA